jgi:hypothetical protein
MAARPLMVSRERTCCKVELLVAGGGPEVLAKVAHVLVLRLPSALTTLYDLRQKVGWSEDKTVKGPDSSLDAWSGTYTEYYSPEA